MKSNETLVLNLADTHIGKKTQTYNLKSCERRLETFAQKVIGIKNLVGNGYHFEELVVNVLGDVVDGTGIYPSQAHHQDETGALEQLEQFTNVLGNTIKTLSEGFPKVRLECIPGNHGRVSKFANEADNFDLLAYRLLRARFQDSKKIDIRYGGKEGLWVRRVAVRRHTFLLYHGHGIRMYQQIPWYGLFTRIGRWATTKKFGRFDAFACGHFHTCGYHPMNRVQCFMNGTMVTSDDWAIENFGYESSNQWFLCGSSDRHTTTFQFPLTV